MNMGQEALSPMLYGFLLWTALTLVVLALVSYRYVISRREDDTLHLADAEAPLVAEQKALAARLGRLDEWKRRLTVVDLVLGLGLAALFVRNALRGSGLL